MRFLFLLGIGVLAVFWDFYARRIPNKLIVSGLLTGLAWQWCANGPPGLWMFAAGTVLPVILLGILHYFKMIGAGDLKYFMIVGGFVGPALCLKCVCISFLIAAVISLVTVVRFRILMKRLILLIQYIKNYVHTGIWVPYIENEENPAYVHLSLPIFLGSLLVTGGWI